MDLDDLLAKAAPPVSPRTVQMTEDLHALAQAGEPRKRAGRTTKRTVVGAGMAVGVLGLGVVGAAAAMNDGTLWFTTTSAGDTCEMEFSVAPVGPQDAASGEPDAIMEGRASWPSTSEQNETASEARRFLRTYDYDSVDRAAAVRAFDVEQRRIIAKAPPGEAQPLLTGNDLETSAVRAAVFDALSRHLRAEGLSPDAIVTSTGSSAGCEK
jgi:hypothetical protein